MCKNDQSYEDLYDDFWKDIIEKDGVVNMDQVKRELSDYHHILDQVPEIYMEVTGGMISKPNTCKGPVLDLFRENFWDKGIVADDVEMILNRNWTQLGMIQGLRDYFEIGKTEDA